MAFIIETQQDGLSTALGTPVASVALAIAIAAERASIARTLVGSAPPFRLVTDGEPISEADALAFAEGGAANGFTTY